MYYVNVAAHTSKNQFKNKYYLNNPIVKISDFFSICNIIQKTTQLTTKIFDFNQKTNIHKSKTNNESKTNKKKIYENIYNLNASFRATRNNSSSYRCTHLQKERRNDAPLQEIDANL